MASTIGGAHAQVPAAAELSLALRLPSATRATIHLLAAQDLPLWSGALGALPPSSTPLAPHVQVGPAQTEAVIEAIGDALAAAELRPQAPPTKTRWRCRALASGGR